MFIQQINIFEKIDKFGIKIIKMSNRNTKMIFLEFEIHKTQKKNSIKIHDEKFHIKSFLFSHTERIYS